MATAYGVLREIVHLGPMAREALRGSTWSDEELDLIVADYFEMLAIQRSGVQVNKAQFVEELDRRLGRGRKSIEFKHMNVSAVMQDLALPIVQGYAPMPHIQLAIFPAIDRYLSAHPEQVAALEAPPPAQPAGMHEAALALFVEPPPLLEGSRRKRPEGMERLVRKFDPVERDFRNRALGKAGEALIVDLEKRRLHQAGAPALAKQVRWVADLEGDGAGYDILSFTPEGERRLIEVKTTNGGQRTPFFLTRNEELVSREKAEEFRLYRLYDFSKTPRLFELPPPLSDHVVLETETWRAGFG